MKSISQQVRTPSEIEQLRGKIIRDRISLAAQSAKLLFISQPKNHPFPRKIWTAGLRDFAIAERGGVEPHWSKPLGDDLARMRGHTESGKELVTYDLILSGRESAKKRFRQIYEAAGPVLCPNALFSPFDFLKNLFEFSRSQNLLTWEVNEQPGHPETKRPIAWLYDIFEAVVCFLNAELESLPATNPNGEVGRQGGKGTGKKRAGRKPATVERITEACEVHVSYQKQGLGQKEFCTWWNGKQDKKVGCVSVGPQWLKRQLALVRKLMRDESHRIPAEFANKLKSLRRVKIVSKNQAKNSRLTP